MKIAIKTVLALIPQKVKKITKIVSSVFMTLTLSYGIYFAIANSKNGKNPAVNFFTGIIFMAQKALTGIKKIKIG